MLSFREHLTEAKKRMVAGLTIETLTTAELDERLHSGRLKFKNVPYKASAIKIEKIQRVAKKPTVT